MDIVMAGTASRSALHFWRHHGPTAKGAFSSSGCFTEKLTEVSRCFLQQVQYCHKHGRMCPTTSQVDLDVSGLPCQDNSRCNRKRKLEEGRYVPVYMVWAKKHKQMRTALLILENTPDT